MGLMHDSYVGREHASSYDSGSSAHGTQASVAIKRFFEKHQSSRVVLLLIVLLGTSMVIGDGILTPTIADYSVFIACVILVVLFSLQHWGTRGVSFLFAPILVAWLLCISAVGIYNIICWNPRIIRAVSPHYAYNFFKITGKAGWIALGSVVLCTTGSGAETMFADLGHFSKPSLRMAFAGFVYPCLVLAYMGEAAYLSKHREDLQSSFYKAIPDKDLEAVFWPVFILATLATVVASQAVISATFSIVSQCRALSCFPRVKIIHTSTDVHGQIYIPEVNWILMVLCLAMVLGFRETNKIANAYGIAVITLMFVTTCLMFLINTTVWERNVFLASIFVVVFGSVELLYLSACVTKCPSLGIIRVPGIGLVYTNVSGVPPIFSHFVINFPAFHQVLVFVTLETSMVPKVPAGGRYNVSQIGPPEFYIFCSVVRYGYKDVKDMYDFESQLVDKVAEFLQSGETSNSIPNEDGRRRRLRFRDMKSSDVDYKLFEAREAGVVYMIGNTYIMAREASSFLKKFVVNVIYGFLRQNCRRPAVELGIPHRSLIEVGMVYYV
ncbi:hypothetical protein Nepgr_012502 [Nepenthes gracilis]|uniref:Potassium transporter n=1 Tax=Nepenthes gracilis TaxID=150966 RepID=A0AAD3SHM1_NEPGR|nr:hypothetical protein Nepgr_012502 [Nepenthes gracilis]